MTTAIIATTPQQMQEAQGTTATWVARKIDESKRELSTARQLFDKLVQAGFRTQPATTSIKKAQKRVAFYEKVSAALDAGYVIVPPFDVQLFAVRTNRKPVAELEERTWGRDQNPPVLAIGEGKYVHPRPVREETGSLKKTKADKTEYEVALYENTAWRDVDLPLSAHKPQIIDAVKGAMEKLLFDALGIVPYYRDADPIIVGHIRHWNQNRKPLTFFVAWWLDERDL